MSWDKEGRKNRKANWVGQTDRQEGGRALLRDSGVPSIWRGLCSPVLCPAALSSRGVHPPQSGVPGPEPGPDRSVSLPTLPLSNRGQRPKVSPRSFGLLLPKPSGSQLWQVSNLKIDSIDWKLLKTIEWEIIVMFYVVLGTVLITKYTR